MSLTGLTITEIEASHNPNEGRVIINENFRKIMTGVTESINSITGSTGSTGVFVFGSGSTGDFSIKAVNDSGLDATGYYSFAGGYGTLASGNFSHAGGAFSIASASSSFVHSTNSLVTGNRSVVLGGQNITGTTDDTVYVPNLNIHTTPSSGSTNYKILVRSSDGMIRTIDQPLYEYKVNLTQSSTNAPIATTLGDITLTGGSWSYSDIGSYYFTKTGAFSAATKVEVDIQSSQILAYTMSNAAFNIISAAVLDDNIIEVRTGSITYYPINAGDSALTLSTGGVASVSELLKNDILSNTRFVIRIWS